MIATPECMVKNGHHKKQTYFTHDDTVFTSLRPPFCVEYQNGDRVTQNKVTNSEKLCLVLCAIHLAQGFLIEQTMQPHTLKATSLYVRKFEISVNTLEGRFPAWHKSFTNTNADHKAEISCHACSEHSKW